VVLHLSWSGLCPAVRRQDASAQQLPRAERHVAPRLAWLESSATPKANTARLKESALIGWLQDNGMWLSTMSGFGRAPHPMRVEGDTVDDFEPSGRGLLARKDITQGQPLVEINTKLVMTKKRAQEVLGSKLVPDDMGEYLAIAMLLVHERALGEKSFWAPYIDILPTAEEVGQSFVWEEEELALLTGSGVIDSTRSLQTKLVNEYNSLVPAIIEHGSHLALHDAFEYEAFVWAMSMLFSRGVNLREIEELAMVPYADLINHSPYSQAYFMTNNVPLSKQKEVVLYADRNYAKNDQVLISYGQKSNAELLLLYGFVIDRNLFDQVELTVSLQPDDPMYDEKVAFLRSQGLAPRLAFPLLIDRYSSELLQYLRLCCSTPEDGALGSKYYSEPISYDNEKAALNAIIQGCDALLAGYPEAEEADAALMSNSRMFTALSRRARMAIKLRRNEKRILKRTIGVCETALINLEEEGR